MLYLSRDSTVSLTSRKYLERKIDVAPTPKTPAGRYRILSSSAVVRMPPLCLGFLSFGTAWAGILGSVDEQGTFNPLDAFGDAGELGIFLGNWIKARGNRDLMLIATKFTNNYRMRDLGKGKTINYSGNNNKSLFLSVEASKRQLQTHYIDLLYELIDSPHILVKKVRILYLGASDTPAWVMSAANVYTQAHSKTPFSVYQGRQNVMVRSFQRDIIPMAHQFSMALVPSYVLGGGKLQTEKQIEDRKQAGEGLRAMRGPDQTEDGPKASNALNEYPTIHAACVMRKTRIIPLIGGRKVEHLHDNIKALDIGLSHELVKHI
ncbi:NADP-dependent oxidoreductase domain-containing protein [Ilyonectria sp. MPI-CAGE-AT-0026]|nr:NADP-dependent oxidoreductase domain-containing protein [Ilyonectria sp. MPI-CAGE-AT-0026]